MQWAEPRIGEREDVVPSALAGDPEDMPDAGLILEDEHTQAHGFPLSITG
jgi:hypothetical protein